MLDLESKISVETKTAAKEFVGACNNSLDLAVGRRNTKSLNKHNVAPIRKSHGNNIIRRALGAHPPSSGGFLDVNTFLYLDGDGGGEYLGY